MSQPPTKQGRSPDPSYERLETYGQNGGTRRADVTQRRTSSPAARDRMVRLITGPVPIALVAVQGLLTIVLAGPAGRGSIHRLLLAVVLAENVGALFLRHRHPLVSLTAISLTYAVVDYPPATLPALLVALLTVLTLEDSRRNRLAVIIAAVVLIAAPAIHGDFARIG